MTLYLKPEMNEQATTCKPSVTKFIFKYKFIILFVSGNLSFTRHFSLPSFLHADLDTSTCFLCRLFIAVTLTFIYFYYFAFLLLALYADFLHCFRM